jgi:AcrR family transcriptional regulator
VCPAPSRYARRVKEDAHTRREPSQARARSTVEAILEAAARILADTGLDRATTTRIAHVAGVSVGSLYQYFPGKDALFGALVKQQAEHDLVRVRDAVEASRGLPLAERLLVVFDAGFAPVLARPRLFVFILTYLPTLGLSPMAQALERALADEVRRVIDEHRHELTGVDSRLISIAVVGASRGALLALAHHAPETLDEPGDVRDVIRSLVLGVLHAHQRPET